MDNPIKVDFSLFVSGLFAEGMVALGIMKNPLTLKVDKNLSHAMYIIDTIDLLKTKTTGNLTKEESELLEQGLHQLRMIYLEESKKDEKDPDSNEK